jgi:ribonuclease T
MKRPVAGFNASFDWAFVNWYFHKFIGENPLGIGGLDINAYAMGKTGSTWQETSSNRLSPKFRTSWPLSHNALDDALVQGEIFAKLVNTQSPKHEP